MKNLGNILLQTVKRLNLKGETERRHDEANRKFKLARPLQITVLPTQGNSRTIQSKKKNYRV